MADEQAGSGVLRDDAGFRYYDFRPGAGPRPRWGQLLKIHFVGYTVAPSGELRVFDSTFSNGSPYLLKHGNGQQIMGLELALHSMAVGGQRRVVLPQETLGFTQGALGPLPASKLARDALQDAINNEERSGRAVDLVYDLTLLDAYDDVNDRGFYEDIPVSIQDQERKVSASDVRRRAAQTTERTSLRPQLE